MTDLAAVVEQQLDELLAQAEPAWLDREPEVREERVYREDDTYEHQKYAYYTKQWEAERERQARQLFPDQYKDEPLSERPKSVSEMFAELDVLFGSVEEDRGSTS